ncbi:MAG: hypothetical protein LUE98_18875 [Tannerellaceae bacterium]|nr:hypothetical protein [Tannerellaceae bacterium]
MNYIPYEEYKKPGHLIFFIVLGIGLGITIRRNFIGSYVLLPRLLISIITGWVTIFFGTNMLGEEGSILGFSKMYYVVLGFMMICTYFFVYSEIGKVNPF